MRNVYVFLIFFSLAVHCLYMYTISYTVNISIKNTFFFVFTENKMGGYAILYIGAPVLISVVCVCALGK